MMTNTLHTIEGTLTPRPPCDFIKTLKFVGAFTPTEGEQSIEDGAITKAVTLHGRAVAFTLRNAGTIEEPRVAYQLASERPLSEQEHAAITDRIRFFLSLDDDLQPFYTIGRADPIFAPLIERFYGLHQPRFLTPFEIACWSILVQRVPMALAHRMKTRLVERWGTSITLPDGTYRAFPEVEQLAAVSSQDLEEVVRNRRKLEYLQAVIQFFQEVDEQFLRYGNYEEVATRIRNIRGIGAWSAAFILIRGLGRMERAPVGDKELVKAASQVYNAGKQLSSAEIQRLLDHYGNTQGYWAFYTRITMMQRFEEL
jgi:DNA-3-methyladenine glycosylase II